MTDELPPIWALDKAAKAAGYDSWPQYNGCYSSTEAERSIIAHARTIAQYEQPPVDEVAEAMARFLTALGFEGLPARLLDGGLTPEGQAALAQFKRELEGRK
jgi:hypothetical protein